MLQSLGNYNEFPFYGACNTKPADNAITLSGDIREETLPNGNIRVGHTVGCMRATCTSY